MEKLLHLMLREIERLAVLANNKAVPRSTQVYIFGSYAPADAGPASHLPEAMVEAAAHAQRAVPALVPPAALR